MQSPSSYIQKAKAAKGFILGIVSAISYGTNPLFAVPLYKMGYSVASVLFYRYALGALILSIIMLAKGVSFRLTRQEAIGMAIMGILFAISSVLLFDAYNYMDIGLASTLLFMEPVFVVLIMWIVYREKISKYVIISIAVCMVGVICLCNPGEGAYVTVKGVVLVMLSALAYGIYMVAINKSRIGRMSGMRITFYSLLFGQLVFVFTTYFYTQVQTVDFSVPMEWGCILGISVVPTIISIMTVAIAVKYIGSVTVAILGALEPVTGLLIGSLLFDEVLTIKAIIGIVLILTSVIVITKSHKQ